MKHLGKTSIWGRLYFVEVTNNKRNMFGGWDLWDPPGQILAMGGGSVGIFMVISNNDQQM